MTDRMTKQSFWSHAEYVLQSGEVAVKGEVAYFDTAAAYEVVAGQTATTLLPIGYFEESKTGDGTKTVRIRLFRSITVDHLDNDETNPVLTTDVGSECYVVDGHTVSISSGSSTRSKSGRVWDVIDDGATVLVEAGPAVTGPTGSNGAGAAQAASRTAIKAIGASSRFDGQLLMSTDDGSLWRFVAASSVATDVAEELVLVPGAGTGRWLRADKAFTAKVPIAFGMADGDLIWTVPTGFIVRLTGMPFWEVTTGWTGGSASTIGIASTVTGYDTAGDILGGASGQATAVLGTSGVKAGTIGPKLDTLAEIQAFVMVAGDDLTYEEITSAYTAGAGFVCVPVSVCMAA